MENAVMEKNIYKKFALTLIISFVIMYAIMFLNIFQIGDLFISLNRMYMALLMISAMAVIMVMLMGSMYKNKKLNALIASSGVLVFILALACLRNQAFITDVQYMKGMIPHHSSAILTSTNASIKDPEVRKLADNIIEAQKREIAEMKQIIVRMEKNN